MADICEKGLSLLYGFEGKHTKLPDGRYKAYLDIIAVPNIPTIYAGLTKGVTMGMILTEDEGERMLRKELAVTEDAIERLVTVDLNQHQFSALTVLVYNIGVNGFANSTLLKLLNQGKYSEVPAQMARWCNAGGKKINGLVRRRAAEAALFMEPMQDDIALTPHESETVAAPAMPQRVEEAKPSVVTTISESRTIWASLVAMTATICNGISQGYDWVVGVGREAGPEVLALKQTLSPFDALVKLTPAILIGVTIAAISVVVIRKIQKR